LIVKVAPAPLGGSDRTSSPFIICLRIKLQQTKTPGIEVDKTQNPASMFAFAALAGFNFIAYFLFLLD
jgi:hypothetical protein